MDDKPLVSSLDNLITASIVVASGAGWHSGSFAWIVQVISQVKRIIWVASSLVGQIGFVFRMDV